MNGPAENVEPSAERGLRRRPPRLLLVAGAVALVAVTYVGWVYTRPAPFAEPVAQPQQCIVARDGGFVTHGTVTLRNESDEPVELLTLSLDDADGILLSGVPSLVPVRDVLVGNQTGYPPRATGAGDGIELGRASPIVHGEIPPTSTAGTMNLVVGLSPVPGRRETSFSSLRITYKDGWRTRTWRSRSPVRVVTAGDSC
jgi:hypothetical protein